MTRNDPVTATASILKVGPPDFSPRLVIFDKDGTLIDFHAMWASWVVGLAARLELATGCALSDRLYAAMGLDATAAIVLPGAPLAASPMPSLRALAVNALVETGLEMESATTAVNRVWHMPDPVNTARPLADLPRLFDTLHSRKVKIGVATSDDRAPTDATLAALGLSARVDAVIAADEHVPSKPRPDMVLHLCGLLRISPADAAVVGDTVADMQMGRAAGAGLLVGVLSGVTPATLLHPHADVIIPSIAELVAY